MNTSCCRAKILVEYFGEDFSYDACLLYVIISFISIFHIKNKEKKNFHLPSSFLFWSSNFIEVNSMRGVTFTTFSQQFIGD